MRSATRHRHVRRERRKSKASGWTRLPPVPGKVGHGTSSPHVSLPQKKERRKKINPAKIIQPLRATLRDRTKHRERAKPPDRT